MENEQIQIYYGENGRDLTSAAVGRAIRYACEGKSVFIIRFLQGRAGLDMDFIRKLEPEIKLFSFNRFEKSYGELSEEEQAEEQLHMKNGLNFAKKVLLTDECDVLILDGFLDLAAMGIVGEEAARELLDAVSDDAVLIMSGTVRCGSVWDRASRIVRVEALKETGVLEGRRIRGEAP